MKALEDEARESGCRLWKCVGLDSHCRDHPGSGNLAELGLPIKQGADSGDLGGIFKGIVHSFTC